MSSSPGSWVFYLANSSDLSRINPLGTATARKLSLQFNRPGSFEATIPIDSDIAMRVAKRSTCVIAERNGRVVWSGDVTAISDDAGARTSQITATGWLEELDQRYVRSADLNLAPIGSTALLQYAGNNTAWAASHPTDADLVSLLVTAVNGQRDTASAVRPTHVNPASVVGYDSVSGTMVGVPTGTGISTTQRTRTYNVGDNYGQSIRELSDIEDGCDLILDPATRVLFARDNTAFADRTGAHFSLGTASDNLQGAVRNDDGLQLFNRISTVTSGGVVAVADDVDAINAAGIMLEYWTSLSDVVDVNIAGAYANAELVYRRYGVVTYSLTPSPAGEVPRMWDDFELGDKVYFSVDAGRFKVTKQAVRVFSLDIDIDEAGNEVVGELGVSPAT